MRRVLAFCWLLMLSLGSVAQKPKPQPGDFPLTVHVKRSRIEPFRDTTPLHLWVVISGKSLEFTDFTHSQYFGFTAIVVPGDYRARLSHEETRRGGQLQQTYEFLWPDGTLETFDLVGESE